LLECSASSKSAKAYGYASRIFNSETFDKYIKFAVSPTGGYAYDTLFTLSVQKPLDEALTCEFSYENAYGEVRIEDNSLVGQRLSS
jgi:hypothetical protein